VLCGTIYDCLHYAFHQEREANGTHIKLRDRRPSARDGLCKIVVRDCIALLFGEGRFPSVDCEDQATRELLVELVVALMPIMQHGFEQNQALGARKIRTTDANSATQQHVF
jgi:hypothetical protein